MLVNGHLADVRLTRRERDVLTVVAGFYTNYETAEILYISQDTVKSHLRTIYTKLGVSNRGLAVRRARELGLIPEEVTMSLRVALMVGHSEIGSLVIGRTDNTGQNVLPAETVSTYLVFRDGVERGKIKHRYGDGPWELVRKALELPVERD